MSKQKNKVLRNRVIIFFTTLGLIVSPIGDMFDIRKNLTDISDPVSRFNNTVTASNIHHQYNFFGDQSFAASNPSIPTKKEKQLPRVPTDNTAIKSSRVDISKTESAAASKDKRKTVLDTIAQMNERIVFLLNKLRLATADSVISEVMEELHVFATMDGKYCHILDSICQYLDEHPALELDVSKLNVELGRIVTMSKDGKWADRAVYVQTIKQRVESRKIDG